MHPHLACIAGSFPNNTLSIAFNYKYISIHNIAFPWLALQLIQLIQSISCDILCVWVCAPGTRIDWELLVKEGISKIAKLRTSILFFKSCDSFCYCFNRFCVSLVIRLVSQDKTGCLGFDCWRLLKRGRKKII